MLGVRDGGPFDGTFDFVVQASGLYPVRCVWYENGGGAHFQLFSVDPNNPTSRILLNDPNNPAGDVVVYQPLGLLSALGGPMLAAAAMALSSVSVVLNSLRLRHLSLDGRSGQPKRP